MTLGISVVIPTYNRAHLIRRAVDSVLAQCGPDDEVIVADDGSQDATAQALAAYGDRIRHLALPHGGAGRARNAGIRAARKPLVAFLDSDDEWLPGKIDLQRALLAARPDVLFCFSDFRGCEPDGRIEHHLLHQWHGDPRNWDEILGLGSAYSSLATLPPGQPDFRVHIGDLSLPEMQSGNYVSSITMLVRREQAGAALHFAEDVGTFEDLECIGRLTLLGRAAYLDLETACQNAHSGQRLTGVDTLVKTDARLTILERVWGSDAKFLSRHRSEYEAAIASTRRLRVRALLLAGNGRQAREELRKLPDGGPWPDRAAAALPEWLLNQLLRVRRVLRGFPSRHS
jgi:GT2 family glycosyltransferase